MDDANQTRRSELNGPSPPTTRQLIAGLSKIGLVMKHGAWEAAGRTGLPPTQAQALALLHARRGAPALGVSEVAAEMAVGLPTASEAISALQHRGLVRKRRSSSDGRAVALTLTAAGRREAARASDWPDALVAAVGALGDAERGPFMRGLVRMIAELEARGAIPAARMCVSCLFFEPMADPGAERPHHCRLLGAPVGDADLRLECAEMQPHRSRTARESLVAMTVPGAARAGSAQRRMSMMKAIFYHAGCPVCVDAERAMLEMVDKSKYAVEVVHLGHDRHRVAEAERAGVRSVPALVLDGRALHINHGADLSALK